MVAAVVRKMLETMVTLGNISRVLLNLIKRFIFVMLKNSSPFHIHAGIFHIFSCVHQLRLLLAFTYVPLPYLLG